MRVDDHKEPDEFDIRPLAERIKERLEDLGLSPRAASLATGHGPDAIRNIFRAADAGRKYSPRADTLSSLAHVLQTRSSWLLHGQGEKDRTHRSVHRANPPLSSFVECHGVAQAGVYRSLAIDDGEHVMAVPGLGPDPRFSVFTQFAWQARGDSMDLAGIVDGSYVLAISYHNFTKEFGILRTGLLVILERIRENLQDREISIRHLTVLDNELLFESKSSRPVYGDVHLPGAYDPDPVTDLTVRGVAVGIHRVLNL